MSKLDFNVMDFIMQTPVENTTETVQHKRKTVYAQPPANNTFCNEVCVNKEKTSSS